MTSDICMTMCAAKKFFFYVLRNSLLWFCCDVGKKSDIKNPIYKYLATMRVKFQQKGT